MPLAIYAAGGSELFLALAYVGFLLNLFNLLPVLPLDGGRAMAALSPSLWFVGYALLVAATIAFPNPVLILCCCSAASRPGAAGRRARRPRRGSSIGFRGAPGCWWRASISAWRWRLALGVDATFSSATSGTSRPIP